MTNAQQNIIRQIRQNIAQSTIAHQKKDEFFAAYQNIVKLSNFIFENFHRSMGGIVFIQVPFYDATISFANDSRRAYSKNVRFYAKVFNFSATLPLNIFLTSSFATDPDNPAILRSNDVIISATRTNREHSVSIQSPNASHKIPLFDQPFSPYSKKRPSSPTAPTEDFFIETLSFSDDSCSQIADIVICRSNIDNSVMFFDAETATLFYKTDYPCFWQRIALKNKAKISFFANLQHFYGKDSYVVTAKLVSSTFGNKSVVIVKTKNQSPPKIFFIEFDDFEKKLQELKDIDIIINSN